MKKMKTKKYQKPKVTNTTCSPEPIEAGCCLRSCGGSPHHVNAGAKKGEELITRIDRALKR